MLNERSRPLHQLLRAGLSYALPPNLFLTRLPQRVGRVALTFDDGPHPRHTHALLDVLAKLEVRATFFVLGEATTRHATLVRRMEAEGHQVGSHTFAHRAPGTCDGDLWRADVDLGVEAVDAALGHPPRLFRPPYGKVTPAQLASLWLSGQGVVLWNVDPRDYACADAAALEAWFGAHPLQGGDVVLLHDVLPHSAGALPRIVGDARAAGLEFGTVGELVACARGGRR